MDKSRTYKQLPIHTFTGTYYNVDTLEDPVFQRLAKENKADVFATETAVAAIMTAPKSNYSWDVLIKKFQDKLFIDKRDEQNMLDLITVNETSAEQPTDDDTVNGVRQIMKEATNVQIAWQNQSYQAEPIHKLPENDPFIEVEGQVAVRQGYIYKIWKLSNKKKICIRHTVHSYIPKGTDAEGNEIRQYQNNFSFLEYEGNKVRIFNFHLHILD